MNNPLVSVIIPTYKRPTDLLLRAVDSVLNQTYKNVEIVIVDDNAREDIICYREQVIQLYDEKLKSNPKIKFIMNNKNLGGALSRNEGIKACNGDFVTFLDDDDYFLPEKVEHQITYMINAGVNFSFTDLFMFNEEFKVIDKRERDDIKSFDKDYLLKYHITKNITGTETFMSSKDLLIKINMFDNVLTGHEFYLMLKIILHSESIIGYFKSNDIVAFRTSGECISNGPNKIKGENDIYKKRKEYFNLLTLSEKRYTRCRHYSVLGISYIRRKKPFKGLLYLFLASLVSPVLAIKQLLFKKR